MRNIPSRIIANFEAFVIAQMYFFDCMDRVSAEKTAYAFPKHANHHWQSNLANAKTDGLEKDLHLKGNDYSLLILLFYIPFGLFDLPWNLLIKRFSGRIMLSISETLQPFEICLDLLTYK